MVSITDCVVEGLKYPLNNLKKLLIFGVLFALVNLISLAISSKFIGLVRAYSKLLNNGNNVLNISQLPAGDINMIIGLSIVSFIIMLFIMGYEWDIVKFSIDKKEDLPGFGNILRIFINGIKYFIVSVAYNIIPIILLAIGIEFITESFGSYLVLISLLLFIITSFLLIMALNNMVAYDSIKKAFDFKEITDNIANLGWGKYIGIIIFTFIVYIIIMVAVGFALSFIAVFIAAAINNQVIILFACLSVIEGLFVLSYINAFFNRVFGSVYRESIK